MASTGRRMARTSRFGRLPSWISFRSKGDEGASWWSILVRVGRNQFFQLTSAVIVTWLAGATLIHLFEGRESEAFGTWSEAFWNSWLALFNGMNDSPKTLGGRVVALLILFVGVGLIGLFTGNVASIFVERRLRRREVSHFEMEDHLVLCNWAPRGLEWIQEVHSKIIQEKRPVVIIHDDPEMIDLPDKQDDAAFNDVYIVKGDPTNEVILRRARVAQRPLRRRPLRRPRGEPRRRQDHPHVHRPAQRLQGVQREHRRRMPQSRQPPPPRQGRGRRDHLLRRAGPEIAREDGHLSRHDQGLPGVADRRPRRQRDVPARGPDGAGRPRLRRGRPACSSGTATTSDPAS